MPAWRRSRGLTKLRRLNLQSADVTDAGIDVLRSMPDLEELSLYRTKVSNAGLAKLAGLKNLRSVDLRYSRATGSGVRDLASNLPKAEILILETSNREPRRAKDAAVVANQGEAAIAEWLRSIGGKVQMTDGHVTSVSLNGTTVVDKELQLLTKLTRLTDAEPAAHRSQPARARARLQSRFAREARPRPHAARRLGAREPRRR